MRTHVGRVFAKTGARDRAQAVVFAYESGVVRAGDAPRGLSPDPPRAGLWTTTLTPPGKPATLRAQSAAAANR